MGWDRQQGQFAKDLLAPDRAVPDFVAKTNDQPSVRRFNIYRNNVMVSLTDSLLESYPVVAALVGEEFATAMARVYAGDHLPRSPVLLDYGAGYGDFIESFEPANSLPYLADVARLEWLWSRAYYAADCKPLAIDALTAFEEADYVDLRFSFCPAVQLLASDHPVLAIWTAHQQEEGEKLKIEPEGQNVLVTRPQWEVEIRVLDRGLYAFLVALREGKTLGMSIDRGNGFNGFEAAKAIELLFASGCVAGIAKE